MAELFVQISESLDGFIDDRNGDLQRFTEDTSLDELATETLRSIDGMIFGRKAHALLARFWPTAGSAEDASTHLEAQAALQCGFVDEIRLIQYPVILGDGTPLFASDGKRRDLELIDSRSYDSGATVQRYRFKTK